MDALELSNDPKILLWMKLLSHLALSFNLFCSCCYWGVYLSHPSTRAILSIPHNSVLWVPSYPFYRWIWETKSSSFFSKVTVGPECWCPSWPLSHYAMYSLIWLCYTSPCLGGHTRTRLQNEGAILLHGASVHPVLSSFIQHVLTSNSKSAPIIKAKRMKCALVSLLRSVKHGESK